MLLSAVAVFKTSVSLFLKPKKYDSKKVKTGKILPKRKLFECVNNAKGVRFFASSHLKSDLFSLEQKPLVLQKIWLVELRTLISIVSRIKRLSQEKWTQPNQSCVNYAE